MPINGLTNPPKSFLKLGQIRKGEMKTFQRRDGSTYTAPVDLDYFRVTFRPDEPECAARFLEVYGEKPRRINIRFPFKTIEEVWDANYECYSKGGLIAKAGSNDQGAYWIFYRNHENGEVLVRNGSPVGAEGRAFFDKPIDLNQPIYTYKDSKGNAIPVFLETTGRLQVVIPEIASLRVGYLEFRPGSPKDIAALSRELAAIEVVARGAGKDISGIPMVLCRREEAMTKNIKGQLSQGESWLVHIDLQGTWGSRALEVIERKALPEIVDGEVRDLLDDDWDDEHRESSPDPVIVTGETKTVLVPPEPSETNPQATSATLPTQKQSAPDTQPAQSTTPGRPYPPEVFLKKFLDGVKITEEAYALDKHECKVTEQERHMVAAALDKILGGNKLARYEFCEWLCGFKSTADMSCVQIKVLMSKKILNIKSFDDKSDETTAQEIKSAHEYVVKQKTEVAS